MKSPDLFIFVGELSADLHGAKLIEELRAIHPQLNIYGVGGPRMRQAGISSLLPMEEFQVMGFLDVFLALPRLTCHFFTVRRWILKNRPRAVILIDYPGFNLRMATHLRKQGFKGKICQYICPTVWAWGKKRIDQMAQSLDLLLTILPFEVDLFSHTSLERHFVGHPLIQRIANHTYQPLPFVPTHPLVAIFPGSRIKELRRNLAVQLGAAKELLEKGHSLTFAISVSNPSFTTWIEKSIRHAGLELGQEIFLVSSTHTYDLMRAAQFAIAKSGTVTLELALHRVPTVVTYGLARIDLWIAKYILRLRLPYYCIVNIIAQAEIFPELIGPHLTKEVLISAMEKFINDPHSFKRCQAGCSAIAALLTDRDANREAAQIILEKALI